MYRAWLTTCCDAYMLAGMLEKAGNRTECALLEFAMRLVDQPAGVERIRESTQILQVRDWCAADIYTVLNLGNLGVVYELQDRM
jgi:hypothetical protein